MNAILILCKEDSEYMLFNGTERVCLTDRENINKKLTVFADTTIKQ